MKQYSDTVSWILLIGGILGAGVVFPYVTWAPVVGAAAVAAAMFRLGANFRRAEVLKVLLHAEALTPEQRQGEWSKLAKAPQAETWPWKLLAAILAVVVVGLVWALAWSYFDIKVQVVPRHWAG